ncbi:hypothetical protein V2G26_019632 [Clonostachys chloroleuca]
MNGWAKQVFMHGHWVLCEHASLPRLAQPQDETSLAGQYLSSSRDDWSKPLELPNGQHIAVPATLHFAHRSRQLRHVVARTCANSILRR